jgi:flagellar basal body P-ring formation protein FlgA
MSFITTLLALFSLALPAPAPSPRVDDPGPCPQRWCVDLPTLASAAAPQMAAQSGPALKAQATVSGDIVRIGDLVEHAGAVSEVAIFRAPDLGQTGAVSADRVIEAVRSHQIIGLDTRGLTEIAVTRLSRVITPTDIETRIVRALAGQFGPADAKNLAITFDNEVRTFHVEPGAEGDLRVQRLGFEPRSGRFDVTFELPGSMAARRTALRYTGTLSETFEAVVPMRTLAAGEVLKPADLVLVRRPKAEFAANVLTSPTQAAGLGAKRALRAGQVLRDGDLQRPELVTRNDTVTITFEVPGIVLTMRGQALESGALGDLVNVLNIQSKRTIQATVIGHGRVSVGVASARLAANSSPTNTRVRAE